ncbi:hypothetical protein HCN44_008753 [Aphidius gifuensis]|uniref:Uncharacterized protein n=1 Tax=Aphidius gifuensis TaxID=684658 RepID=A0A834XVA2_APHGI|nr:uncharacterized protein LOC122855502 isoform X2 [Aphidius gifuensis]KAF7991441.1 hypothetical protein HCN44_008753 [Aphidius gifuensis]
MYVTCKCLNVSIKTRSSEFKNFNEDDIELSPIERANEFFKENLAMASKLEGINKEQSGLVESENIGSWVVNKCNNCNMLTHAVHKDHGAAMVLINTNMIMSFDEIQKLKTSPNYSNIFKIIIDHSGDDSEYLPAPTKYSVSQLSNNLQLALTNIQHQLEQSVQRKSSEIEEKIREFTAEQYQHLEEYREQAHKEHRLLARLICNQTSTKTPSKPPPPPTSSSTITTTTTTSKTSALITPAPTPVTLTSSTKIPTPIKYKETIDSPIVKKPLVTSETDGSLLINESNIAMKKSGNSLINKLVNKNDKKLKTISNDNDFYDNGALFPLEGMDDTLNVDAANLSTDESDTDGQDEGIHIPRGQRIGQSTLAKSLPVTVPNFSFVRRTLHDQDEDLLPMDQLDPHDIRASIKALAKSVHGDTVFGDLPRPRFSTQI